MPEQTPSEEVAQLYRRIMRELEPDLLLENIPALGTKYPDESGEETAQRKDRYSTAFTECFRRIDAVLAQMKQDSHVFKAHVLDLCRKKDDASSAGVLHSIENSIAES